MNSPASPYTLSDGSAHLRALAHATAGQQALCTALQVRVYPGDAYDLSNLEQEYADENDATAARYRAEDAARLAQYGCTWWGIGIQAVATIAIPLGPKGPFHSFSLASPGLWNIESDSLHEYLQDIGREELNTLRTMLQQLAVFVPDDVSVAWDPDLTDEQGAKISPTP